MPDSAPVRTGDLARRLGVARSTLSKWYRAGWITPAMVTPGGEPRWVEADVRRELKAIEEKRRNAGGARSAPGTADEAPGGI